MKINTIIFDLDGTLLDTLEDLYICSNHMLRNYGFPERTKDEVRRFVGNGLGKLVERLLPGNIEYDDKYLKDYKEYYAKHCLDNVAIYPGINELINELLDRGYKVGVVSNKVDPQVKQMIEKFFPKIKVAIGEMKEVRKKPAPDSVFLAISKLNSKQEECIYVGDSEVDIETSNNAGIPCVSCLWGFRDKEYLIEKGAKILINKPSELLEVIK